MNPSPTAAASLARTRMRIPGWWPLLFSFVAMVGAGVLWVLVKLVAYRSELPEPTFAMSSLILLALPAGSLAWGLLYRSRRTAPRWQAATLWALLVLFGISALGLSVSLTWRSIGLVSFDRDTAESLTCVNQLKQVSIAMRIYSTDNLGDFPPNLLILSNELVRTRLLHCPGDSSREPPTNWTDLNGTGASYVYLLGGSKTDENDVQESPLVLCPIHHHVVLGNGSVQRGNSMGITLDIATNWVQLKPSNTAGSGMEQSVPPSRYGAEKK